MLFFSTCVQNWQLTGLNSSSGSGGLQFPCSVVVVKCAENHRKTPQRHSLIFSTNSLLLCTCFNPSRQTDGQPNDRPTPPMPRHPSTRPCYYCCCCFVVVQRSPPPVPFCLFGRLKGIPLRTCETVNFHEGKGAPGFLLAPRQECSRARHGRKRPK